MQLLAFSGYLGVEVFFVLSGFLIGNILHNMFANNFSWPQVRIFLKRRWFRTLPNYYLILLVNIAIAGYIGYDIAGLWRYFFFQQNFASPMLPFFTESWSLSIEEFAYLILPIALLMVRGRKRAAYLLVIVLLWSLPIIAKIFNHFTTENPSIDHWNVAVKSVVIFRLDAIFTGVIYSFIYCNFRRWWIRSSAHILALGLFLIGFLIFGIGQLGLLIGEYPFFWNVVYLPLTSVAVACFLPVLSGWLDAPSAFKTPVTFTSKISYSIYLLHYGVVLQLMRSQYEIDGAPTLSLILFTSIYFVLSFVLSGLLYRFYEFPMMNLRDT